MTPRELFQEDGFYIHTESILSPDTLQRAASGLEQVRDGVYDTHEKPDGRGWNPGDDLDKLCKIEQPQIASHALREALRSPRLGQLAAEVTGANQVQVWWVQGLYKPSASDASTTGNVGWHQDQSYWADWEEGSELFTAWLALSDVTMDAGPMAFVPGSHRWGLLEGGNFFSQNQTAVREAIRLPQGETWREVPDLLPPGGVSLHHRMLFHGSHQNTSGRPRLSLAIHLRTDKSTIRPDSHFARHLNNREICPVIFEA